MRDLADVLDDLVEGALAPPQRPHPVVRRLVAVERDFDPLQAVGGQPIDNLRREEQAVGDDADVLHDAACFAGGVALLGQVVGHRQVEQRLTAEQRQNELLWTHRVETIGHPGHDLRGGLHRHLVRELVVVAVVALEAVVTCEVALQCCEDRQSQLVGVLAHAPEVLLEFFTFAGAALDDEAVVLQRSQCLALFLVERCAPL